MTLPVDIRPSAPQENEIIAVDQLGPRLFAIFSQPTPKAVTKLSEQYYIYTESIKTGLYQDEEIKTDYFSPAAPWIKSVDLNDALEIATVTICHHNLGIGPQIDLLAAKQGDAITLYSYPKRQKKEPIKPQLLDGTLAPVTDLLRYQPDRWSDGAAIQRWRKNTESSYTLIDFLSLKGIGLNDLLTQIKPQLPSSSLE